MANTAITNLTQPTITADRTVQLGVSSDLSTATFQVKIDSGAWTNIGGVGAATYRTPALTNGFHTVYFRSIDGAGVPDSTPASRIVNIAGRYVPYRGIATHTYASLAAKGYSSADQALAIADLGCNVVRTNCLRWPLTATNPLQAGIEPQLTDLINAGIKPVVDIQDSINPGLTRAYNDIPGYALWCENLAKMYGDQIIYEVLNEPNLGAFMYVGDPGGSVIQAYGQNNVQQAQRAAEVAKAAYPAIKAIAPTAEVIGPSTSRYIDYWWEWYLNYLGTTRVWDSVSYHPYTGARPSNASLTVSALAAKLAAHGWGGTPIWMTEFGWSDGTDGDPKNVSTATAVSYISEVWDVCVNLVKAGYPIRGMTLYNLYEGDPGITWDDNLGMVENPTKAKKPQFASARSGIRRDAVLPTIPPPAGVIRGCG